MMRWSCVHNNIRRLRFEHDEMTQQELADRIGVTRQTVAAIEKEKYSPSLEATFRIAAVFDQPPEAVFTYDVEQVGKSTDSGRGQVMRR